MDKTTFLRAQKLFNFIDDTEIKIAELKSFLQYAGDTVKMRLDGGGYNASCVLNKARFATLVNSLVADLDAAVTAAKSDLANL